MGMKLLQFQYNLIPENQGKIEGVTCTRVNTVCHFVRIVSAKTVDRLLQLPMQEEEKHRLVDYLKTTQEAHSSELLLLHLLQRSRFIEAVRLNNRLKSTGAVSHCRVCHKSFTGG